MYLYLRIYTYTHTTYNAHAIEYIYMYIHNIQYPAYNNRSAEIGGDFPCAG